jgi:cytochrome P450
VKAEKTVTVFPPGPRSPRLWQMVRTQQDFVSYMDRCAARYGPIFTLRVYPYHRIVVTTTPGDFEKLFQHAPERFIPGLTPGLVLEPILGANSMFLTAGDRHRRQRHLVKPAFRGDVVAGWSQRIADYASEELEDLPVGKVIEMRRPMRDVTLNVICRLVLGIESADRAARLQDDLAAHIDPRLALLLWAPTLWYRNGRLNPLRGLRKRRMSIDQMLGEQIELHRADSRLDDRDDVLAAMLRATDGQGQPLDERELRDQLLTLLGAGHESSTLALTWAVERLSRNPATQDRLIAELDEGKEEYLLAFIKESLRTRPPVLDVIRTLTRDLVLSGYRIPAGTLVTGALTVAHRSSKIWGDPHVFRPERFLDERPPHLAYLPFGGGVRRCPGASLGQLEMRLVLKALLRRFRVSPAPGPEEKIRLTTAAVLAPSNDGQVILQPRAA